MFSTYVENVTNYLAQHSFKNLAMFPPMQAFSDKIWVLQEVMTAGKSKSTATTSCKFQKIAGKKNLENFPL